MEFITLAHGSGGKEMDELIRSFNLTKRNEWKECDNDASLLDIKDIVQSGEGDKIVFTTDSFIVDPIFFPGGDIGHLAFCGTANDLLMMGAKPLGISLGLVIEEGFPKKDLDRIIGSIKRLSEKYDIPIVTGDTKVMDKGKLDKIIINTSGIGAVKEPLTMKLEAGDRIIISGGLGEHAVALLSKRFDYQTDIETDSKPLVEEMDSVRGLIKCAKDPTRGGIAAILNDICAKNDVGMTINEDAVPIRHEVEKVVEMLGINAYELACEGRMVCVASKENAESAVNELKRFNKMAAIIGEVTKDTDHENRVIIQTMLGKRILPAPTGRIVPRIC